MAEWFKALVLKTCVSSGAPWVRIPLPPPGETKFYLGGCQSGRMGPPAKRLFGLYRIAGSNPVPPAAQSGKRTCRSGETGEVIFTSFLFATTLIFFCPTASPYLLGDVLKIRKGRAQFQTNCSLVVNHDP
jgi:hypothetical protein